MDDTYIKVSNRTIGVITRLPLDPDMPDWEKEGKIDDMNSVAEKINQACGNRIALSEAGTSTFNLQLNEVEMGALNNVYALGYSVFLTLKDQIDGNQP
jgi:hypothetical protein